MKKRLRFGVSAVCASQGKKEVASALSRPSHAIEYEERQIEMSGTGDSPAPRGDSPRGTMSAPVNSKGAATSRGSGGLVYPFSVVATSRCDVRAACSGTTPSIANVARIFVPPATTRAGTAQRAIPTLALNTHEGQGEGNR